MKMSPAEKFKIAIFAIIAITTIITIIAIIPLLLCLWLVIPTNGIGWLNQLPYQYCHCDQYYQLPLWCH